MKIARISEPHYCPYRLGTVCGNNPEYVNGKQLYCSPYIKGTCHIEKKFPNTCPLEDYPTDKGD